jgi:serine/threonine protein kinase
LIEKEIGKLINLCHPCIAAPIGFIFGSGSQELKVIGLYSADFSLGGIERENPGWCTPTAKAKAVAGRVLGLRFAHSLGLIHGHLTTNNIVFDMDHRIQMTDFLRDLSGKEICGFSRERWHPEMDIHGFVSIFF